jgi:sugar-specific transcriptional regulator TrmB
VTLFPHQVELLVKLGLTFTEAKIFLVLCVIGTSTARMISENAGVAREVIYQVIPTLQQKGLIESVLTTPQTYRAIPAEYAFEILLKQKNEETRKTEKDVKESLRALRKVQNTDTTDCYQITIIPGGKALLTRIIGEMRNTKKSVNVIMSWQKFLKWHRLYAKDEIKEAKLRNVKFQVLLEKEIPQLTTSSPSSLIYGSTYFEDLEIRIAPNASLVNMLIFDDKKIFIDTAQEKGLPGTSFVYSNNPCLTPQSTSYFITNWDKAIPLQSIKTPLQAENTGGLQN